VARRSSIRRNLRRCFHPLEYVTDANAGIEVPSCQTPARGGEEIARRRAHRRNKPRHSRSKSRRRV
jgi:hypothetical protein